MYVRRRYGAMIAMSYEMVVCGVMVHERRKTKHEREQEEFLEEKGQEKTLTIWFDTPYNTTRSVLCVIHVE
jgi:hypothetical protein